MLVDRYKEVLAGFGDVENQFLTYPSNETAKAFIEKYFSSRSKASLFNFAFTGADKITYSRSTHMVSAYYLGRSLQKIVQKRIMDCLKTNTELEIVDFDYPWFLSCLFHDVFTEYEQKMGKIGEKTIANLIKAMSIEHTVYDLSLPPEIKISKVDPIYKKETVEQYYEYRAKNKKIDHGIVSGYYAFDRLTKNFIAAWTAQNKKDQFDTVHDGHTLIWDKDQIWVFAIVADAIIAHNIWHLDEDGVPAEVVIRGKEERKLSIQREPLAFFLSLIDTIEPVKYFTQVNSDIVLRNIDVTHKGSSIEITQSSENIFNFESWYEAKFLDSKKRKMLPLWLNGIDSDFIENEGKIVITFPDSNRKTGLD